MEVKSDIFYRTISAKKDGNEKLRQNYRIF